MKLANKAYVVALILLVLVFSVSAPQAIGVLRLFSANSPSVIASTRLCLIL